MVGEKEGKEFGKKTGRESKSKNKNKRGCVGRTSVDLEPHGFELHRPTYTWDFFDKCSTTP